ncbi:MAG: 50S ribosomal protein L11 methyltransferase [Bacteroidales bacterium]|nr:50S ribosomal protein L11 methyltransferase [Bacteroidales bacterium]
MGYIELKCTPKNKNYPKDIIIARLSEMGFESFVENDCEVLAYIPEDNFRKNSLKNISKKIPEVSFIKKNIKNKNWNAEWESNYSPVIVSGKCIVKAPFHKIKKKYKYEIIIQPKMSFGTGHHETTKLMIGQMLKLNFKDKNVLDMGCGTGVLAIYASMAGAKKIMAIDNNEWAYKNSLENVKNNNASGVKVIFGNARNMRNKKFDIILANINRNILLKDFENYVNSLSINGIILMSGFFTDDICVLKEKATNLKLKLVDKSEKNRWAVLKYIKKGIRHKAKTLNTEPKTYNKI